MITIAKGNKSSMKIIKNGGAIYGMKAIIILLGGLLGFYLWGALYMFILFMTGKKELIMHKDEKIIELSNSQYICYCLMCSLLWIFIKTKE